MRSSSSGVQLVAHAREACTFANPSQLAQSWYPIAPATRVRARQVASFELFDRRIALYRDRSGHVRALDARCPHLGADLGEGSVDGDRVRCAFHGWCFGPDGGCVDAPGYERAPGRRARVYPVQERWGLVWVFNGPSPLFNLPLEGLERRRALRLPSQRIRCHPHMVLANGLDLSHYDAVHDFSFSESPELTAPSPYMVRVALRGRPRSRFWRVVTGCARRDVVATFTTIGASVAWASLTSPIVFDVLFTGRPDRTGGCVTQTVFLFERPMRLRWLRGLGVMAALLHDDRRVLDTLQFRPQFAEHDEALRLYAAVVNRLGSW
jgi:phenylpropionate dioxygenase-like ring-hydroxylating dioxygenase large terminal subunit